MAGAALEAKQTATLPEVPALYWFGMLPATSEFPCEFQTRDRQENGNYYQIRNSTSQAMWELPARVWIGKCRFFQSLPVKGFNFPAFSEVIERQATVSDETTRSAFPGGVKIMRPDEAKAIIKSAWRNVVRYGNFCDDIMSLKNASKGGAPKVRVLDLGANDECPSGMSKEEFLSKRIQISDDLSFDQYRDVYLAHFVYLMPVEAKIQEIVRDGVLDLGEAVARLPHQRLNTKFFSSPPQSLAEMYPQAKA